MALTLEEVMVKKVGQFGRCQCIYLAIYGLVIIPYAMMAMSLIFMLDTPDHSCIIPNLDAMNLTTNKSNHIRSKSLPVEQNGRETFSNCQMYDLDYGNSSLLQNMLDSGNISGSVGMVSCQFGWTYDDSVYQRTMVSEWNLVCDRLPLKNLVQAISFSIGGIIGVPIVGRLSDMFGRKKVVIITTVVLGLCSGLTSLARSIFVFIPLRIIQAATSPYTTGCAHLMEMMGPDYRHIVGSVKEAYFGVGYCLITLATYYIRDWRTLQCILPTTLVPFLLVIWFVPESPRWLLSKGRNRQGVLVLKKLAGGNGNVLDEKELHMIFLDEKEPMKVSFLDIFKNLTILKWTIALSCNWFSAACVFLGLSFYTNYLEGNMFLNHFIGGIIEIPAVVILFFLMKFSRRYTYALTEIVAGIALVILPFIPKAYLSTVGVTLATIGKFGVIGTWAMSFVYTSEIFPTPLRSTALGICYISVALGSAAAPFISDLAKYTGFKPLPLLVMSGIAAFAGLMAFLLPETKGKPLPNNIQDSTALMGKSTSI